MKDQNKTNYQEKALSNEYCNTLAKRQHTFTRKSILIILKVPVPKFERGPVPRRVLIIKVLLPRFFLFTVLAKLSISG